MARNTTLQEEYKRLRSLLNPAIRGKVTDAILYALAEKAGVYLINNIEAVHDQLYISTASERYLDQRLADYNLIRPANVGLGDDVFRNIGIGVINRKQVRDLIERLLETMFGEEATRATSRAAALEPYSLVDGDTLSVRFDGSEPATVIFSTDQFSSISAATAQEVADAITRSLRRQGREGSAFARDDGNGPYVVLISNTVGPQSSVRVLGGRAQNELRFDSARPTSATASTQWTIVSQSGGSTRFTWSGGSDPSLGKVRVGDYVNIYSSAFDPGNNGTFTITDASGGSAGDAYFEIQNPAAVDEIVVQGIDDGVLFFNPLRNTLNTKLRYAAAYQAEQNLLQVFIPATTKVVRRSKRGAAHVHEGEFIQTATYDPGTNQILDITAPAPGDVSDGQYFTVDSPLTAYYVYFDTTGANAVDPAPGGRTGVRVDISSAASANDVASLIAMSLTGTGDFSALSSGSFLRANTASVGSTAPAVNVNVGGAFALSEFQAGTDAAESVVNTLNPDWNSANNQGPYTYDLTQPFTVSDIGTTTALALDQSSGRVINVSDSSLFPDEQGFIILGYGTSHQEGPIPYLARPSNTTLLLSPSYRLTNVHPSGTDVALVASVSPAQISKDGFDYPVYLTDVVAGRLYAEDLVNTVAATGIRVVITILYPSDEGLSRWGTEDSDKVRIWGE